MKHRFLRSSVMACLLMGVVTGGCLFTSCNDWTDPEEVDYTTQEPKEQNPELWARYMESLRVYKRERPHYIAYAHFDNGQPSKNEGSFLRSLPDSLDMVTIANAENITDYDREDIPTLQEKSTRVLYHVDYAAKMPELANAAALGAWLDKAVATATELQLDGFSFSGVPLYAGDEAEQAARKEAARLIVSKLSATGKMLVFEGDPAFVDAGDLSKLSYIVLNTAEITDAVTLKLLVSNAIETYTLPKDKLLLGAEIGAILTDENKNKLNAVTEMTNRIVSLGPLSGLAIYAIGKDYYSAETNYPVCQMAIQMMNPSK